MPDAPRIMGNLTSLCSHDVMAGFSRGTMYVSPWRLYSLSCSAENSKGSSCPFRRHALHQLPAQDQALGDSRDVCIDTSRCTASQMSRILTLCARHCMSDLQYNVPEPRELAILDHR